MREGACGRSVDFEHEHRCPHPQPDGASLRLSARVRLPAERSGSRLSVVHPGPVPYPRRAREQGTTSGRGEELQRVVGRSVRGESPECLLPMLLTYARQGRSRGSSVREACVVLGEERRSPSRRPCPPKRAAASSDRTARARSTGARRAERLEGPGEASKAPPPGSSAYIRRSTAAFSCPLFILERPLTPRRLASR